MSVIVTCVLCCFSLVVSSNFCCRPVKIIRIVSQYTGTVKEIIIKRAVAKIKLTSAVTADGQVSQRHKCDVILKTNQIAIFYISRNTNFKY